jgi:16S rRNA (cytosine1402-N4)-methyltransferase
MNSMVGEGDETGVTRHVPVLLHEVIAGLRVERGGTFLDCTLGGGGHSAALLAANPDVSVVAIDRDARAIARARERFGDSQRISLRTGRFGNLQQLIGSVRFDGVLADLGMSTDQLFEGRGFSFRDTESLDMRMDEGESRTAYELINEGSPVELIRAFKIGGVGREASRIVAEIVRSRPIASGQELAALVGRVVPRTAGGSHPATVVFQALRIAVNEEFEEIDALLSAIPQVMKPGGRLAIICFHSLEDQRVTRQLRRWATGDSAPARRHDIARERPLGSLITKQAVEPSRAEIEANPASRSARLRIFEFLDQ